MALLLAYFMLWSDLITSHHTTPCHSTPHHITPHHIASHHITSHLILPHKTMHPQLVGYFWNKIKSFQIFHLQFLSLTSNWKSMVTLTSLFFGWYSCLYDTFENFFLIPFCVVCSSVVLQCSMLPVLSILSLWAMMPMLPLLHVLNSCK
jgi:hypothetical protein